MAEDLRFQKLAEVNVAESLMDSATILICQDGDVKQISKDVVVNNHTTCSTDDTLSIGNVAADAKVVGDTIKRLSGQLPVIDNECANHYILEQTDIDTTLTQSGKVAEAKVVGDKIKNLTVQIPVVDNEYTDHYILERGDIDTTLTYQGKVADAKVVGDKLAELQAQYFELIQVLSEVGHLLQDQGNSAVVNVLDQVLA